MDIHHLNSLFETVKSNKLYGRYITNDHIEPCLLSLPKSKVNAVGFSVEQRPIYSVSFGHGPKRILMWSQMHGNESTTTKALFDCFNLLAEDTEYSRFLLEKCTLMVIPILNPDGAFRYTRHNANNVDLNRDAQDLSQPESKVLRTVYESFNPDFCFNLHGQRTIFGAGAHGNAATLSFLSPAQDEVRSLTANRRQAMGIISSIVNNLSSLIPNGIGRYDDSFNINCVGDTFQSLGTPTILYEAGHFHKDYEREEVRRLLFLALIKGLEASSNDGLENLHDAYQNIPENVKIYRDLAIVNAKLSHHDAEAVTIVIQYKEALIKDRIEFLPVIKTISNTTNFKFHRIIDAKGQLVESVTSIQIEEGYENDFVLINNKKISLKP